MGYGLVNGWRFSVTGIGFGFLFLLGARGAFGAEECRVFLVPGAFGSSTGGANLFINSNQYFSDYREFFKSKGCVVGTAQFPVDATIEVRAMMLRDQMTKFAENHPVTLVAHSQGGLDARFALKTLRLTGVRSLVTIGTPHQGTPMADWVVDQRSRGTILYWLLRVVGRYDLNALNFAAEMTPAFLEKHADLFEKVPGVQYGAAEGVCTHGCYWGLRGLSWWVGVPPGDGMIPATSQKFADELGEYDLDHLSEVGADVAKRAERQRLLSRVWDFVRP